MEGNQNIGVKVNFDKPYFYMGELIKGVVIFQAEKSIIIEKAVITIYLLQKWEIEKDFI